MWSVYTRFFFGPPDSPRSRGAKNFGRTFHPRNARHIARNVHTPPPNHPPARKIALSAYMARMRCVRVVYGVGEKVARVPRFACVSHTWRARARYYVARGVGFGCCYTHTPPGSYEWPRRGGEDDDVASIVDCVYMRYADGGPRGDASSIGIHTANVGYVEGPRERPGQAH